MINKQGRMHNAKQMKRHNVLLCSILVNVAILLFSYAHAETAPSSTPIDHIWAYQGQVAFFRSGDKVGLIHKDGRILAEAVYDDVEPFYNGYARVVQKGFSGMIDMTGKVIIQPQWVYVYGPDEGAITVLWDGWGHFDTKGEMIIPPSWDALSGLHEGYAFVEKDGKCGFVDPKGNIAIDLIYDDISVFSEGLACVTKGDMHYYINTQGDIMFQTVGKHARGFSEGLALVDNAAGLYGFIDKTGTFVIEPQYTNGWSFRQGLAPVQQNGSWFFIDYTGAVALSDDWEDACLFDSNLAPVKKNGKWGYIDLSGEVVLGYQWDEASTFDNGYASVKIGKHTGYINDRGQYIFAKTKP